MTLLGKNASARGGFSLVELLLVLSIVGILAGLALPNMRNVTVKARAAAIVSEINTVRQATLDFNADQNAWPADATSGSVPSGLASYLPDNYSFSGEGFDFDFENITLPFGLPSDPSVTRMVGVAVTASDADLANALAEVLGESVVTSVGNTHTVVFDAS